MPTPPLSDELAKEAADAFLANGRVKSYAAKALGIPRNTFDCRFNIAVRRGMVASDPVPEGYVIKGISSFAGPDGQIKGQWIKTDRAQQTPEQIAKEVKAAVADYDGKTAKPLKAPTATEDALASVYVVADWHVGLLAWGKEVGADFDLQIANDVIRPAMARLVDSTPKSEQAVVLGLGDLMHVDGYENVTPANKHRLDADGRYPKTLRMAVDLCLYTIDLALRKHNSVLVRILPGNHDIQSSIAVSLALSLYYDKEPRVTVDDSPSRFWWWRWGSVLLGATHGDKARMKDLPLIMASDNPQDWGATQFRHIYTGHIHKQTGMEMQGVTVESFQTPAAPDAWTNEMGYRSMRSLTAITHDRQAGEIMRNRVNIVP